jgi:hypothetical protein
LATVARVAASGCANASARATRCAALTTMWRCAARGGMGTTAGGVGKQTVERLGVFDELLHAGADGVQVWWAL